jgi:hypothetical protein
MIELTKDQRDGITEYETLAVDPETRRTYVLVPKEAYDRFKSFLALDDYSPDEGLGYVNEVMADDDAKDPLLESYQHYGKRA